MSNLFLAKKFLSVNSIYIAYMSHGPTNHNKINIIYKLKIIKKSLNKHGNTLYDNTK